MTTKLEAIAAKARKEPKLQFTSLCHHITREVIWENLCHIPKDTSPGVDGVTVEEAKKDFETCLEIDPDRPDAYKNLGYAHVQTEDVEAAIEAYEKAAELNPEDADGMVSLTSLYLQQEEYPKVLSICEKRLELDPTDVDAVSSMALSYDYMGEQEKARETYLRALENDPGNADLIFNLGRLYYLRGNYEGAIEEFKKVIEQNPEDYDANVNVGNAFLSIGDHIRKKAIEEEEAGKTFSEDELEALREEIESYHCGAVPFLETAVRINAENAGAWYNLGVAYVNCGEAEKGGECFDIEKELKAGSTKEAQDFVEKYLTKE